MTKEEYDYIIAHLPNSWPEHDLLIMGRELHNIRTLGGSPICYSFQSCGWVGDHEAFIVSVLKKDWKRDPWTQVVIRDLVNRAGHPDVFKKDDGNLYYWVWDLERKEA